jgi:hypothetical protein
MSHSGSRQHEVCGRAPPEGPSSVDTMSYYTQSAGLRVSIGVGVLLQTLRETAATAPP